MLSSNLKELQSKPEVLDSDGYPPTFPYNEWNYKERHFGAFFTKKNYRTGNIDQEWQDEIIRRMKMFAHEETSKLPLLSKKAYEYVSKEDGYVDINKFVKLGDEVQNIILDHMLSDPALASILREHRTNYIRYCQRVEREEAEAEAEARRIHIIEQYQGKINHLRNEIDSTRKKADEEMLEKINSSGIFSSFSHEEKVALRDNIVAMCNEELNTSSHDDALPKKTPKKKTGCVIC